MPLTSRPDSRPSTGAAGFTLLEVLVALTLAVVLTGAVAVALPSPTPSLDRVAQDLRTGLSEARRRAMTEGRDVTAAFDTRAGRLIVNGEGVAEWPADVAVTLENADGAAPAVVFHGAGGASGGQVTLDRDGVRRVIVIRWLTGAVVMEAPDAV